MNREQWLSSMTSAEYSRLIAWSKVEPIGTDAMLMQMAKVCQSMAGGSIADHLVLDTTIIQTPEEIYQAFKRLASGNDSKP